MGPPVLTLAYETVRGNVVATVTVPAGADRLTLSRKGPSGQAATVRGWQAATVIAAAVLVIRDFEAAVGVPLVYTATAWANSAPGATGVVTATITAPSDDSDDPWLTDLARPTNTQRITVESLRELAYQTPVGAHSVLGRRSPILTSDVTKTPTFDLIFVTMTDDARDRAGAILGNGLPVLLRTPPEQGVGNLYFGIASWTEERASRIAQHDERRFRVRAIQLDRPDPALWVPKPPQTYALVKTHFATYAALKAARPSYDALLWDYTDVPGDVVPWPPDDV